MQHAQPILTQAGQTMAARLVGQFKTTYFLTLIFLLLCWFVSTSEAAAMKVGIIADPEFANSASLLTAELSKNPEQFTLLEREEIDRVLQEQALAKSGAAAGDWVKVGRLLGADGLILLQKRNTGEKEAANVGWVLNVSTGVVLGAELLPKDTKSQSEVLKGLLERCSAKMEVKAGEAVPVSVVPAEGIAYRFDGDDGDREIFQNGLMLALMRQPSVFVLQREQLETILFERNFAGANSEGFWAGANIVQCRVGPDPLDKGILSAALSLTRRDGSKENWVLKAKTAQELVKPAADSLCERLKLASAGAAFDPQRELPEFQRKLDRLYYDAHGGRVDRLLTDTAVTMQALGDNKPFNAQIAVLAPMVKACGGYTSNAIQDALSHKETTPARLVAGARQMMDAEQQRLSKMIQQKKPLGNRNTTDPFLFRDLMTALRATLSIGTEAKDPALTPELSALRGQFLEYLQLAYSAKWYDPHRFLLTYGEYFFDDPNKWLDSVEALFRPPFREDQLYLASEWILNTIMEVPRSNMESHTFPINPADIIPEKTPVLSGDPKIVLAALPRLKQWAYSKEAGLRIAGARILLREKEAEVAQVDRTEMAHIIVQALGEILPAHCRFKGPADPFPGVYMHTKWLSKVDLLAHKELLDLSIRTLGWAERADMAYLLTQPANKEEAALLGQAYKATTERLHAQPKGDPFAKARGAFPEAFALDTPQTKSAPQIVQNPMAPSISPLPHPVSGEQSPTQQTDNKAALHRVKTAKWLAPLTGFGEAQTPPAEGSGKLWYVMSEGRDGAARLNLRSIDIKTGASTILEIPIQQRERFVHEDGLGHQRIFQQITLSQKMLVNENYLVTGPLLAKGQENECYWMILNRKTGGWKEVALPVSNGEFRQGAPFLIRDKVYWPFGVEHPEISRGLLELNAAAGSWKFHPLDSLKTVWEHSSSDLRWNRERNILVLMTDTLAAEFDLESERWLDARPTAAGEALLNREDFRSSTRYPEADCARKENDEFRLDIDPSGNWNVKVVDPETHRLESFVLKLAVEGLSLSEAEKQALKGTDGWGITGGKLRSGLWFHLRDRNLFWLPWSEIRKETLLGASPDLLFSQSLQVFSTDSNHPQTAWKEFNGHYELIDRDAKHGSVLLRFSRPPLYLWGHRDEKGVLSWRPLAVPPLGHPVLSRQWSARLSPDGVGVRYIASGQGELREWRAQSGEDRLLFTAPEGEIINSFGYAPDGVSLAWAGMENLYWQPASGKQQILALKVSAFSPFLWSPDGNYLAVHALKKMQILTRTGEELAMKKILPARSFQWTADSKQWITRVRIDKNEQLQATNVADGTSKPLLPEFKCEEFILSADGEAVVASGTFLVKRDRPCILRIPLDGSPWKELAEGTDGVDFLPINNKPVVTK